MSAEEFREWDNRTAKRTRRVFIACAWLGLKILAPLRNI